MATSKSSVVSSKALKAAVDGMDIRRVADASQIPPGTIREWLDGAQSNPVLEAQLFKALVDLGTIPE